MSKYKVIKGYYGEDVESVYEAVDAEDQLPAPEAAPKVVPEVAKLTTKGSVAGREDASTIPGLEDLTTAEAQRENMMKSHTKENREALKDENSFWAHMGKLKKRVSD